MIKEYFEEIYNLENNRGHQVHCVYNYIDKNNPLVIVPSQYEKTIRHNLICALYLLNNGYNVLRYDNRFHLGNSYGDIENFTLQSAYEDLGSVIDFVKSDTAIESQQGLGLLGTSLSSRIAFRYLANNPQAVDVFLSLVGVVNMQHTLQIISGINGVQALLDNPNIMFGIRKLLNYPISWDNFIHNMIEYKYHSLESTKTDVSQMIVPTYLIVAEDDQWVPLTFYHEVFSENLAILRGTYKIPKAGHELYKNPKAAEYALEAVVKAFQEFWGRDNFNSNTIFKPNIAEIITINRQEREREFQYS